MTGFFVKCFHLARSLEKYNLPKIKGLGKYWGGKYWSPFPVRLFLLLFSLAEIG